MEGFRLVKKESDPVIRGEVEENTTFYYSNFKLFNEYAEIMFSKYIAFKRDLQAFLGDEWQTYAKKSIYKTLDESTIFVQSQDIFNAALEIWLEQHKDIKQSMSGRSSFTSPQKTPLLTPTQSALDLKALEEERKGEGNSSRNLSENGSEDSQSLEVFQLKLREKFSSHEINEDCFKAIVQAFHVSATKVWKELVLGYFGDSSDNKNGGFLLESKKFLFNKLQNLYNTKSKMLKPILVATERIKDYVIDSNKLKVPVDIRIPEEKDLKNLSNFSSNLQTESPSTPSSESLQDDEQDMKKNFKHMKISNQNSNGSVLGKRSAMQANTVVEIKKVNKKTEKLLNQNTIEFAAYYVNNMVKTSNNDWQISRNFVTNMVEVNYNKLVRLESQLHNKSQEVGNDVRIRFIQPAQEFYNRLMEIWIIFKTNSLDREILFTEYLDKVKDNLGSLWNERFIAPTQNFFMTLYYEWNHLKQVETDSEEKVLFFTKKVKESMLKVWEDNIVKKVEELSNRSLSYNN